MVNATVVIVVTIFCYFKKEWLGHIFMILNCSSSYGETDQQRKREGITCEANRVTDSTWKGNSQKSYLENKFISLRLKGGERIPN